MNSSIVPVIIRALLVVLLQGLVLHRIELAGPGFNYITVLIYPVVIMLLPMKVTRIALIFSGFLLGISVDMFYSSYGVHAGASVLTAFARPMILRILEPRGGYTVSESPNLRVFDLNWYSRYTALVLAIHLPVYFSLEVFAFAYFGQIILKSIIGFAISFLAIMAFMLIFNPKR